MTIAVLTCACPDSATALDLAQHLVEQRLAACVQVLPGVTSVYRWQGQVETAGECLLLIKTAEDRIAALTEALLQRHPYELPELLAVQASAGLAPYLQWVQDETRPDSREIPE